MLLEVGSLIEISMKNSPVEITLEDKSVIWAYFEE